MIGARAFEKVKSEAGGWRLQGVSFLFPPTFSMVLNFQFLKASHGDDRLASQRIP
jgi:hypothetical protein